MALVCCLLLWANFDRLHGEMDHPVDHWGVDLPRMTAPAFPAGQRVGGLRRLPPGGGTARPDPGASQHRGDEPQPGHDPGRATRPEEDGKGRWHRRERGFGRFQRVLRLPLPVEADKVEAKLENGLLRVTLPKGEEARSRRKIAVKAEA